MPERAGVYVISREKTNKLKITGDNVNFGLCDSRDYFARPSLNTNKVKHECTENVADIFFNCV